MPIITMFSGSFCEESPVVQEVISRTGYQHIIDDDIVAEASRRSGLTESKIKRSFTSGTSVFNKFTHEKERSIACIKLVVAEMIAADNVLITCFSGQLIPKTISHILRVCLIAPIKYRIARASRQQGVSEKEASKLVLKREEDCTYWIDYLFNTVDPWDSALYDIILPIDKMTPADAAALIADYAG
ncbi:MAG: cytidylate kinase family protein, partial [Desulfobacterales bacterium]